MSDLLIEKVNIEKDVIIKKKKGRPRKNPLELDQQSIPVEVEKKKRGRKKKEKVVEEVKQKKKRGRKAALKFFSSTIRKKIPLTTLIHDNDKSILHLDIKEEDNSINNAITYDVIKDEYNKFNKKNQERTETEHETERETERTETDVDVDAEDDILYEYINNNLDSDKNLDINDLNIKELYEKRLQSRLIQDNQLVENLEHLHNNDQLLSKLLNNMHVKSNIPKNNEIVDNVSDKQNRKRGYFKILENYITDTDWIDKIDASCWWCCHTFNSIPIGMPCDYDANLNKFRVKGIFCSFACMLAYTEDNNKDYSKMHSLINSLYKKLTGISEITLKDDYINMLQNDYNLNMILKDAPEFKKEYIESLSSLIHDPLQKAPNRSTLKMFGGILDIEEFRNSTKENKIYKMVDYPMYISRDYIEEVDLQRIKNVNKNVFNKKNNIIQSNNLDESKLQEVKNRINSSAIITNNSIDKFISF